MYNRPTIDCHENPLLGSRYRIKLTLSRRKKKWFFYKYSNGTMGRNTKSQSAWLSVSYSSNRCDSVQFSFWHRLLKVSFWLHESTGATTLPIDWTGIPRITSTRPCLRLSYYLSFRCGCVSFRRQEMGVLATDVTCSLPISRGSSPKLTTTDIKSRTHSGMNSQGSI